MQGLGKRVAGTCTEAKTLKLAPESEKTLEGARFRVQGLNQMSTPSAAQQQGQEFWEVDSAIAISIHLESGVYPTVSLLHSARSNPE